MNNNTEYSSKEPNSKAFSDNDQEEEQPILPAETSKDDPTKTEDTPDKKKVIVVTPTSTKTKEKTTTTTTTTNTTQQPSSSDEEQEQEQSSVPAKAKEIGQTLKEKVKKTITKTEEKTKPLKDKSEQTAGIGSEKNAHDIQALGSTRLEKLATVFEDTMSKIDQEHNYEEQERQLKGYKKLLEEQINVIDSRLKMAKRLKKVVDDK
jgi:hypothetical protein